MKNKNFKLDKETVKRRIEETLRSHFGKTLRDANKTQLYKACAMTLRDEIMDDWYESNKKSRKDGDKQLYYLSIEFLMGRALSNNLSNLLREDVYREAFEDLGLSLYELIDMEKDPGLGNGGLGRLAACFLDSLATMGLPGHGFGLRYQYGLFKQRIVDGYQVELPDPWLEDGNVWEVPRPEEQKEVHFGGTVVQTIEDGKNVYKHEDYMTVIAMPYDTPIVGYDSSQINTLRLWSAKSPKYIDMKWFGRGDYVRATAEKELAEVISKVLYPEDIHYEGKALRLKQSYFFVSASMQCILDVFKRNNNNLYDIPNKIAIHINDTHPALAIPELMRILIDEEGMDWNSAWYITTKTFAYTNHTIMGEALERWPESMLKEHLPRIYMIIREINERYCAELWKRYPGQWQKISEMAIISYDEVKMAPLSIVGSSHVNGVSPLHTEILKNSLFKNYYVLEPHKFVNITNGITQRRWLLEANPGLSNLIKETIGDDFILQPWKLKELEPYAQDSAFRDVFAKVKYENKKRLAEYIKEENGIELDLNSIFDVQVKRMHEYKRQLLNVLHIIYLYHNLKDNIRNNNNIDSCNRTFIFGGKASPGYHRAKLIIKLINAVADKVNNDKEIENRIKVVFIEDYRVSLAEKIIPAADLSEQISTAGKEASGTGNMKFMMNGALTIGTMDGANIEIDKAVGRDNIFIFGLTAEEVLNNYQHDMYNPRKIYDENVLLKRALDALINGEICSENTNMFMDIYRSLLFGDDGFADQYMVLADFESYANAQKIAESVYKNKDEWYKKAIINVANSGYFSSDRSISEYNSKIWHLKEQGKGIEF